MTVHRAAKRVVQREAGMEDSEAAKRVAWKVAGMEGEEAVAREDWQAGAVGEQAPNYPLGKLFVDSALQQKQHPRRCQWIPLPLTAEKCVNTQPS